VLSFRNIHDDHCQHGMTQRERATPGIWPDLFLR
jgi:hypothetical protein